jgi:hypothetical protein
MARKVFFSFHYQRDSIRAGQVRNSNVVTSHTIETSEFIDAAKWESVKRNGDQAIKNWIASQLNGTSVTVVLIGSLTSQRRWINYEIEESKKRPNGLLGIYIHNCRLFNESTDIKGANPLPSGYNTYDWVNDNGRANLGTWVEAAAKQAGR